VVCDQLLLAQHFFAECVHCYGLYIGVLGCTEYDIFYHSSQLGLHFFFQHTRVRSILPGMVANHSHGSTCSLQDEDSDKTSNHSIRGPHKPLTVTFQNLTLTTKESGANHGATVLSEVNPANWIPWKKMNDSERVRVASRWSRF
jgi:hypothetical protein